MRRTLEDIIPPSRRQSAPASEPRQQAPTPPPIRPERPIRLPRSRRPYTPAIIAIGVIIVSLIAIFVFSGASVAIDPMTATANLSGNFTASTATTTPLSFAVVSVSKMATQTVASDGSENVNQIAQGTLTVYNTRDRAQRLIAKTRFESPHGLIYRIKDAITVPAAHGIVPGSIRVTVYADAAGSKYNIAPSSFTVPGLVGTSLAGTIYAKSTTAMSGGFSGTLAKVAPQVETNTRATLHTALDKVLAQAIKTQVPSDYVLLSGAATTTYEALPTENATSSTSKAVVREQGTMTAVVFPSAAFAKLIAANVIGAYSGQPVTLTSTSNLTLIPAGGIPSAASATNGTTFDFALSGNTTVVWTVSPTRIASAVAGKTRTEAQTVLKSFPEVKRAYLTLRPFWTSTFPSDPSKISVVVHKPQTDN